MHRGFFERPTVKNLAITGLAFLLGLALGNGLVTQEAMDGQASWFRGWCVRQVATRLHQHEALDRATFGFAASDLQPAPKKQ